MPPTPRPDPSCSNASPKIKICQTSEHYNPADTTSLSFGPSSNTQYQAGDIKGCLIVTTMRFVPFNDIPGIVSAHVLKCPARLPPFLPRSLLFNAPPRITTCRRVVHTTSQLRSPHYISSHPHRSSSSPCSPLPPFFSFPALLFKRPTCNRNRLE